MKWAKFGAGIVAGIAGVAFIRKLVGGITNAIQGAYRVVLDATRSLFNDDVRSGKFSMPQQIIEDHKTYKNNSRKLQEWFSKYRDTHSYRGILLQGHLFYMQNYDPLLKDKLEFYDTTPLVLSFGVYLAETGNLVQYGINLHMLPREIRERFLVDVFELFKMQYNGEMYTDKPRKINEFSWQTLQVFVDKYQIDFAVRSYIFERMTGVVLFDYQDWGKALALAGNYIGTNETVLRRMYLQHIRNKR